MSNTVKHGKRFYKQMSLEVAVRNPERYEDFLKTFVKFENVLLDDDGILEVYAQLYIDGVLTSNKLKVDDDVKTWIKANLSHNNEWGYPTGYQAAFTRYLKTLSEFGFIYAQYQQPLLISPVAKAVVNGKITLSEAFALQCMRFWRKSPYRRVMNDFNYFEFVIDLLIELKKKNKKLSYYQFLVSLFSDNGDISEFIRTINKNKIGNNPDKAYKLVYDRYNQIDKEHGKVVKQESAFNDYGNSVFRVLQLTGFITVNNEGVLQISPNESRMQLYKALKKQKFEISESAKEDESEYFNILGTFNDVLETLLKSHREKADISTKEYNLKLKNIVDSYGLTKFNVESSLLNISSDVTRNKDVFWFIQAPVKFEFLLTIYAYMFFGDKFIYKPNYICDEAGIPYSHAPGNVGDIEIYNNELYWLIEATLIRNKNQQINNETINLFRHIKELNSTDRYLTLIAPFIHSDTKLLFNVASVITLLEKNDTMLHSDAQTTSEFVTNMKSNKYFDIVSSKSMDFIKFLTKELNDIQKRLI